MSKNKQSLSGGHATMLDIFAPSQSRTLLQSTGIVLIATLILTILAQVQIPWYPIPLTLQPFTVVMIGLVLPWRLALSTILTYIGMASIGMPVLVGFKAGLIWPTSGYLLGYIPMVVLISTLTQYWAGQSLFKRFATILLGNTILFTCGVTVLSYFHGFDIAIQTGLIPFILGDFVIKNALAVLLSQQIHKYLRRLVK